MAAAQFLKAKPNFLPNKNAALVVALLIGLSVCAKSHGGSPSVAEQTPGQAQAQNPTAEPTHDAQPTQTPQPVASATPMPDSRPHEPKPVATPSPPSLAPAATPLPSPVPKPSPAASRKSSKLPPAYYAAAVWSGVAGTDAWTEAVIKAVRVELPKLEEAKDVDSFCPRYESSSRRRREICWLRIVSGLAKFESQFNPKMSFKEPNGRMSIGLLQISDGECVLTSGVPDLKNPVSNLKCGVAMMAKLIDQDHNVDGPPWARGASAYWSTLRPAYEFLGMLLGKKSEVTVLTETYGSY